MGTCRSKSSVAAIAPQKESLSGYEHHNRRWETERATTIAAELNERGRNLFEDGDFDGAMGAFQKALLKSRLLSLMDESDSTDSDTVESGSGDTISTRLAMSTYAGQDAISQELYVYQRECYDEGFGTFSDALEIEQGEAGGACVLLYNMGLVCLKQKKYAKSFEHFLVALLEAERDQPESRHIMPILHNMGRVQYLMGKFDDALRTFEEALLFESNLQMPNPVHIASTKTCMFMLRWCILDADYDKPDSERDERKRELRVLLEDALRVKKSFLGKDHLDVATILNHIGCSYSTEENREKRLGAFRECLEIRQAHLPRDHPDVLQAMENVADTYSDLGELDTAMDMYQNCLVGMKRSLGSVHRDVSGILFCIAKLYGQKDELEKSLQFCEEAVRVGKEALGDCHSQIGVILHLTGAIHRALGNNEGALEALDESLRVCVGVWGATNYRVAQIFDSLGRTHMDMENFDEALEAYRNALAIWKDHADADPADVARALHSCGHIHEQKGEIVGALTAYVAAVNAFKREGEKYTKHIDYAHVLHSLGAFVAKTESEESAVNFLDEALTIKREFYDKPSKDVAATLGTIAAVHLKRGDEEQALFYLDETLREEEAVHGPTHPEVAMTLFLIGKVHLHNSDTDTALNLFRRTLEIEKQSLGEESVAVAQSLNAIGNVYLQRREIRETVEALSEAARIYRSTGEDWSEKVLVHGLDMYDLKTEHPDAAAAA